MRKATDTKKSPPLQVEAEFCMEEKRVILHQCIQEALYDCPERRKTELADRIVNFLDHIPCQEVVIGRRLFVMNANSEELRSSIEVAGEVVIGLADELQRKIEPLISSIDKLIGKKKRKKRG